MYHSPDTDAVSAVLPSDGYKKWLRTLPIDEQHLQMLEWLDNMPYASDFDRRRFLDHPTRWINYYFNTPHHFNPRRPGRRMEYL